MQIELPISRPIATASGVRPAMLKRALARFRETVRPRVRALTNEHARLGDLAISFPALLVALALPRWRFNAAPVIARVIDGARLDELAALAQTPMWLRHMKPEAFDGPLPILPASAAFRRQIANYLPKPRDAPIWLKRVADMAAWADDDAALWLARELAASTARNPRRMRRDDVRSRALALWAWFSQRPNAPANALLETPWRPEIGLSAATDEMYSWIANIELCLNLGGRVVETLWLNDGEADGFEFVLLRTADDIIDEARAMRNCLRTYGTSIAGGWSRVWSVRKDGARVATLEAGFMRDMRMPYVAQLRSYANGEPTPEVIAAARAWFMAQANVAEMSPNTPNAHRGFDQATWTALWRPYWLEKRHIPAWLPLRADEAAFHAL